MIIYKIENNINSKVYIGMTKHQLDRRIAGHMKSKSHIGKALRKYGKDNFSISVVDHARSLNRLREKEVDWIAKLNSKHPNGYNHTDGGEGLINPSLQVRLKIGKSSKDRKWSEEAKQAIRGRVQSEESNRKRSITQTGKPHVSEEAKKRLSELRKGIPRTEEVKQNMRKPKSLQGRFNIACANRDPVNIAKRSLKMSGELSHFKRPEVRKKISEKAKERMSAPNYVNYFSEYTFCREKNWRWLGEDQERICANKECGKTFKIRPSEKRKYCNRTCCYTDKGRAERISLTQKGKQFSESHLENMLFSQRERRRKERLVVSS